MNKNIKQARNKFIILLITFILFQIIGLLIINTAISTKDMLLIKKIVISIIIILSIIIDIVIYKHYISGLNFFIKKEPIHGIIEDFILYPYNKTNNRINYKISPIIRNLKDNQLYFTYKNYDLSYYTTIETKINNSIINKTILRKDGSNVKIGDTVSIYIKEKININIETDKENNIIRLNNFKMKFLHENKNYDISIFNKLNYFNGIVEVEDITKIY